MSLLYYWTGQNYRLNMQDGPYYHLSSPYEKLHDIEIGDSLWAITLVGKDRYVLAAELVARAKGINPPEYRYGKFRLDGHGEHSRYFEVDGQPDISKLIRQLTITANAKTLGRSFQGHNSVRKLTIEDHRKLQEAAKELPLFSRIS